MQSPGKILIVEDDAPLRILVARALRDYGYEPVGVSTAAEMYPLLERGDFQALLLDIMLPGTNGLDICRAVRATTSIPIIIISARGQESDRIVGLEIGADDYLSKPFGPGELIARIRAVLRRASGSLTATPAAREIRFQDWCIDTSRRELIAPDGSQVMLSGAEYDLLITLTDTAQRVVSRDFLLEQSRDRLAGVSDRSVDVLVSRLRSKLGSHDGGAELIKTVRGVGYMFLPAVERR